MQFIIKKYPNGAFSSQLDGGSESGRPADGEGAVRHLLPARGAAGTDGAGRRRLGHVAAVVDPQRSRRRAASSGRSASSTARARGRDLFYLDEFAALAAKLPDFRFIPALSHAEPDDEWTGETGFVHEVVQRASARGSA